MVFSLNLLSELVDLEGISAQALIERLTFAGFEVEDHRPASQASKLISGRILACENHPDSDHLHVLKVDCGPELGVRQIVCGAPNARADMSVIVALPGCELPALGKTIQAGVIRGVESNGMCCALNELGVPAEYLPPCEVKGIHDLGDYPAGDTEILKHLGYEDVLIDINVLPNRPDCLSYLGIAREIAALMGRKFLGAQRADLSNLSDSIRAINNTDDCAKLDILTADLGSRVDRTELARIDRYLELSGHRPISPIVDLGNYVMLLTGQPFHIYDMDRAHTDTFAASEGHTGEFSALDGKSYTIQPTDLTIDGSDGQPLCLAGILGGESSKDDASTRRIAVEAASFYHATIRHTSARLGVSSASSILFGKGVNPRMCRYATEVFVAELKRLFPDSELRSFSDDGKGVKDNQPFTFSTERLNHRLGTSYTEAEVDAVLKALGIARVGDEKVVGPFWRTDLNQQADIDEEVFRFYPADRVPLTYEGLPLTRGGLTETQRQVNEIRHTLEGFGLDEIISFTLESQAMSESVRCFDSAKAYRVLNPLTKDHEFVRIDLVPSMVSILERNAARQQDDLGLYEISATDSPNGRRELLCVGLLGAKLDQDRKGSRPWDFFDLKGIFEAVIRDLGIAESRLRLVRSTNPAFHPGMSADVLLGKQVICTFGELTPATFERPYLILEADLSALLAVRSGRTKQQPFGVHPTVRRDLSFDILGEASYAEIVKRARTGSKLLKDVELFDRYSDKRSGAESIGISLTFSADDRTLRNEEVEQAVTAVVTAITAKLPLKLRTGKE